MFLPKKTQRAAVVGAGAAGMAAALELGKKGYAVTVYEKRRKSVVITGKKIPSYLRIC